MQGWSYTFPAERTYIVLRPGFPRIEGRRRRWLEPGEPEVVAGKVVLTLTFQRTAEDRRMALLIQDLHGRHNHLMDVDDSVIDLRPILDAVVMPRAQEVRRGRLSRLLVEIMMGYRFLEEIYRPQATAVHVVGLNGQHSTWQPHKR